MDSNALQIVGNDRFAKLIGARIVKAEPGYAVVEMKVSDKHMNGLNMVQGGAIFTLADYAFAVASNNSGNITVGINVNISYLKSPAGSCLSAEARETYSGRKISHYNVDVFDEDGELVASVKATGYRKK
ncbi:MAG: PaaI family thioesterase [Clostridiaceae bacterium]|nr:PaaI family thioesterase [Clostridiaceae bacterium]